MDENKKNARGRLVDPIENEKRFIKTNLSKNKRIKNEQINRSFEIAWELLEYLSKKDLTIRDVEYIEEEFSKLVNIQISLNKINEKFKFTARED